MADTTLAHGEYEVVIHIAHTNYSFIELRKVIPAGEINPNIEAAKALLDKFAKFNPQGQGGKGFAPKTYPTPGQVDLINNLGGDGKKTFKTYEEASAYIEQLKAAKAAAPRGGGAVSTGPVDLSDISL